MSASAVRASGRVPPQDLQAEVALLGSAMLDRECAELVGAMPHTEFYFTSHRVLVQCFRDLIGEHKPVTLLTVVDRLKAEGRLDEVGGAGYVAGLTNAPAVSTQIDLVEEHSRIVKRKAVLRRIVEGAGDWLNRAYQQEDPGPLLHDIAELSQTADGRVDGFRPIWEIADELMRDVTSMNETKVGRAYVTDVPVIDDCLWVKDTDLFVIAGRPSTGKTTLAADVLCSVGKSGRGGAYLSAEMPDYDIVARMSKSFGAVDSEVFRKPTSNARVLPVLEAVQKLARLPLFIGTQTRADEALRQLRKLARSKSISCAVVDMLQTLTIPESWGDTAAERLGETTKRFKQLALDEHIPIFLLSSMNRSAGDDGNSRPTMASLKGSGDIESYADTVLLIHRKNDSISEWIFGKAREGVGQAGRKKQDRGKLNMRRDFARGQFVEAVDESEGEGE